MPSNLSSRLPRLTLALVRWIDGSTATAPTRFRLSTFSSTHSASSAVLYRRPHETSGCIRPPMRHLGASSAECPRHHQRELFPPEWATVRSSSLMHHDIPTCIAQRVCPSSCVLEEERLLCAGHEVCARKRTRHSAGRLVTAARRGAEDRAEDIWMPKPKSEGQLSTCRDPQYRRTFRGQRHAKPRLRPSANLLDEEHLVCREPLRRQPR